MSRFILTGCVILLCFCHCGFTAESPMQVKFDADTGQYILAEGDKAILQYNYVKVQPPAGYMEKVHVNNHKYALPRSNYIHPLYGPEGEKLTYDWSVDHPHHRGIYWAWPEVQYEGKMYDLHALQNVFARPTGKVQIHSGNDYAEIQAENCWLWEDKTPIVLETATIRAWPANEKGRYIDLTFRFAPLVEGVTLARRITSAYGGLNIRMPVIGQMELNHHADPAETKPQAVWQSATGIFQGATKSAIFTVFEKLDNPDYPGDYVEYPNLPWFQPAFPRTGTRYELKKGKPLVLQYRLWIASGQAPTDEQCRKEWQLYQKTNSL